MKLAIQMRLGPAHKEFRAVKQYFDGPSTLTVATRCALSNVRFANKCFENKEKHALQCVHLRQTPLFSKRALESAKLAITQQIIALKITTQKQQDLHENLQIFVKDYSFVRSYEKQIILLISIFLKVY